MPHTRLPTHSKIDALMETASRALTQRRYFDCERLCLEALERAFVGGEYERMSRILLPLEECRRQKRDLALDAGHVFIVNSTLPAGRNVRPGCYLVCPPRVGMDGRLLRESTDRKKVPAVIVVREPTTREGLWPVVSIGPVTIRTKVTPPPGASAGHSNGHAVAKPKSRKATPSADASPHVPAQPPPAEWFVHANEALGDKAIASIDPGASPISRVEQLLKALQAHPDHEKLHQALGEACREAAKLPVKTIKPRPIEA